MRSRAQIYLAQMQCGKIAREIRAMLDKINSNPTRAQARQILKRPEIIVKLLELSFWARGLAISHRHFHVGTVLVALRDVADSGGNPWVVRYSGNTRESLQVLKYCGELRLVDQADNSAVSHMIALFVVGQPNTDHGSGRRSRTLTPCEICRRRFRIAIFASTMQFDTLVFTANYYNLSDFEVWTIKEVFIFHNEPLDLHSSRWAYP